MADARDDRVFVRPRKHYRKTYSITEARAGALVVVGLGLVGAWVLWRGAHPDPRLATEVERAESEIRPPEGTQVRPLAEAPPAAQRGPEGAKVAATERPSPAPKAADRGALPKDLAPAGWAEKGLAKFDPSNVYVKIDGRESYYKSFGFQGLVFVTLARDGETTVDLELYDLGSVNNALGAAAGELPEGATPELVDGSLVHLARNALYLARGRYYLRAIGSSEDQVVRDLLGQLRAVFLAGLPGEKLPWSYALFLGLGVAPGKVSYVAENAFSFGFASAVHVGALPDGDTELFVVAAPDPKAAAKLAAQFQKGFLEYGSAKETIGGVRWAEDRYLARVSAAVAAGRLVAGVHGAESAKAGAALLEKLRAALRALPEDTDFTRSPDPKGAEE